MYERCLVIRWSVRWLTLALLLGGALAHADEQARADAAMKDLGMQLRTALVTRMQAEGPVAAIDFCHEQAPIIAAAVAQRHGVRIGRTALRTRSLANAPAQWQSAVLAQFDEQARAGRPVQDLHFASDEQLPADVALRTMRGISTEAPCLVCHGQAVAEPIAQAIKARYPADAATGFAEGELRGAFWVEVPKASGPDARAVIRMSAAQREELRAQMRAHLESVHAILAALAAADWEAVGAAAGELGGSGRGQSIGRGPGRPAAHSFRSALPEAWFSFARPMHQSFRKIADGAGREHRSGEAIAALAEATAHCMACHSSFRIEQD